LCLYGIGFSAGEGTADHARSPALGLEIDLFNNAAPNGTWMIVEPFANDRLEDNLNRVGRICYSASTSICTLASRAQEGAMCLGAQAESRATRLGDALPAGCRNGV
jgi:hypothetical protein